ncbi:MAG: hypothetical protein JOZ99_14880 [Actinobacteria bacterium]|nr:hypothetical protein [Actinomycetota bacterium]
MRVRGVALVVVAALLLGACRSYDHAYRSNVRRFFTRATALHLATPPHSVMRANLDNRNPCAYNSRLSDQLGHDPTYFSNLTAGLSNTDAFALTALEVAVFCPGRYRELKRFATNVGYVLPNKRCMARRCADPVT